MLLRHVSGHLSACNGLALAKANYTKDTPDPVGGVIRRDEYGNPNGVLEEPPAREPVFRHIPAPTEADWMEGIKAACAAYTAKGVTTAQDGFTATGDWGALRRAHELGLLRNRVQILPGVSRMDINTFNTHVSGTQLSADGKISLVETLADGSLQCYTGYLSNPYHKVIYDLPDGPMWRGYPMEPEQQFIEKVVGLHRQGWQLAIHGNGDDAIQMILNAYEEAQKRYPRADARHIVIHCQTVREDQLDRIKRLGVVPSFFVVHTYFWGDRHYEMFLGQDRAERISPLRSALKRGIAFSNHNDTFVTPIDPLLSVWSAVNRRTSGGRILGENQSIPVMDALRSVTSWAAYQACEERIKGSLQTRQAGRLRDPRSQSSDGCQGNHQGYRDFGDHRGRRSRLRLAGLKRSSLAAGASASSPPPLRSGVSIKQVHNQVCCLAKCKERVWKAHFILIWAHSVGLASFS